MKLDNYYVVGLIYQYIRERLKPPKIDVTYETFLHRSIMRSACYQMIEVVKSKSLLYSKAGVEALFDLYIAKLDDWTCNCKDTFQSFVFSTSRDIVIDLEDYIMVNIY